IDRNVYVPYLDPGGYAIVNQKWRYIHYSDDTEELYDLRRDPNEWHNLAQDVAYAPVKQELRCSAPVTFAPAGISKNRLKLVTEGETFYWNVK
ncbi:MAG: sulfatase/phosphatase domain-containing protein, partial [Planctomycetota bacterium]